MKCDTCINQKFYPEDHFAACAKGHWEGFGIEDELYSDDGWDDCQDYKPDGKGARL